MNLMRLAKGRPCTIRSPICNFDSSTTVGAHFRSQRIGAGMGIKPEPLFIAFSCSACHDLVDGRRQAEGLTREEVRHLHVLGVLETQKWLLDNGYIVLSGKRLKS